MQRVGLLLLAVWALSTNAKTEIAQPPPPTIGNCPIFPANNPWNIRVDNLPADKYSDTIISRIGPSLTLNPNLGSGSLNFYPVGIPYNVYSNTTNYVGLKFFTPNFTYPNESDTGVAYPLSVTSGISAPPLSQTIHVDLDTCTLYELRGVSRIGLDGINAESGAIWDLRSNKLRPLGWRSADMAGLPIFAGLLRYADIPTGSINHALRFSAPITRKNYVWPARHFDPNGTTDKRYPSMGMRFRLKKTFDASSMPLQAQIIVQTLKTYGMMLAETGPAWQISGDPFYAWSRPAMAALRRITGDNFEVVDMKKVKMVG